MNEARPDTYLLPKDDTSLPPTSAVKPVSTAPGREENYFAKIRESNRDEFPMTGHSANMTAPQGDDTPYKSLTARPLHISHSHSK